MLSPLVATAYAFRTVRKGACTDPLPALSDPAGDTYTAPPETPPDTGKRAPRTTGGGTDWEGDADVVAEELGERDAVGVAAEEEGGGTGDADVVAGPEAEGEAEEVGETWVGDAVEDAVVGVGVGDAVVGVGAGDAVVCDGEGLGRRTVWCFGMLTPVDSGMNPTDRVRTRRRRAGGTRLQARDTVTTRS